MKSLRSIGGNGSAQLLDRQSKIIIARKLPHLLTRKTDDVKRALDRGMSLIREINRRAVDSILKQSVPGCDQRRQIRHRSTADEQPACRVRKSAASTKPAHHAEFYRRRGRAAEPCSVENVEPGGQRIRHRAHKIIWPGNEREKPRMIHVQVVWKNILLQLRQQIV